MKTNGFIFGALIAALATACGSSNSDDNGNPGFPIPVVERAFLAKYPAAANVKWEKKGSFSQVDFTLNQVEYEAWYNASGKWLQSEHSVVYTALPIEVKEYVANNLNYPPATWRPEMYATVLERLDYPDWYGVELEQGKEEVTLWTDQDIFRHWDVIADFDGNDVPQAIRSFISVSYKNGYITEVGKLSDASYVVNLLDGETVKEVYFNSTMAWQYTEWPVLLEKVPQVVKSVLDNPAYDMFTVKSVSYQQYPSRGWYHFVLKETVAPGRDMTLNIDGEGNIVL